MQAPTKNSVPPCVDTKVAGAESERTDIHTWWLYLLICKDGRTYAGITLDVKARFISHARGKGAKFTRANPPVAVLGAQAFATKSEALQAECAIKKLKKIEKLQWARHWGYRE